MSKLIINLTDTEKEDLEKRHKTERDKRIADRIKVVLLSAEGWQQVTIAQALRLSVEAIHNHIKDYVTSKKIKPENGGSESQLNATQTQELIKHLEEKTYLKVSEICDHIKKSYSIEFTVSGMTKWLKRNDFSFKKPKGVPSKADPKKQEEFIKKYNELVESTPENEPIVFTDGVHPTMATKITYGWIRKGKENDKTIETTASRTRMNLVGSLNLNSMELVINEYDTINSQTMNQHFEALRKKYPNAPKIHQILDQGSYNTSKETKEAAEKQNIILHFLPPYSPNLNPIERLWKLNNEYVRNNQVFKSPKEFKSKIMDFFVITWDKIRNSARNRINDNFQRMKYFSTG